MKTPLRAGPSPGRGWRYIDNGALGRNIGGIYAQTLIAIILVPSLTATALLLTLRDGPAAALIKQYGPIGVAGAVTLWAVERLHRRPWRSVIAADQIIDPRRVVIGATVAFAILSAQLLLLDALTGWRLDLSVWLSGTAWLTALCVIPLQAAGEEILFRGYLTQALGRAIRSRIAIALLAGVIFGAMHLNTRGWLTLPYFLLVALFLALVTLRDEGLELAIGGHATMNLFAFVAVNSGIVAPSAVGTAPAAAAMPFNAAAILVLVVDGALFYGLSRLFVGWFCRPR